MSEEFKPIPGSRMLIHDPRVATSLRRLRAMGIKFAVESRGANLAIIAIDTDSMIEYVRKSLGKAITWDKKIVSYVKDEGLMLIVLWRGSKPELVERLESELKEAEAGKAEGGETGEGEREGEGG